jgi:GAF domain-containing protein
MAKKTLDTKAVLQEKQKDFKNLADAHGHLSKRLKIIQGMAHLFLNPTDLERGVETAMDLAMNAVEAEAGSIILIDDEKQDLYFASARGPKEEEIKAYRLALGQGIAGASAAGKETIAVSDVKKDARFSREMDDALGFETRSVLAAPIVFKNTSLGSLEIINKSGSDVFTAEEIGLVQEISRLLGAFLAIGDGLRS